MSGQVPQLTPEAWRVLWWVLEHGWSTGPQLVDRFWAGRSARTGYAMLRRMSETYHLLQRGRLVERLGRRSQYVFALDTAGLRLLGSGARRCALVRGERLNLTLQLAEARIVREEEGWTWIPAHELEQRWAAFEDAQRAAVALDPRLAGEVRQREVDRAPKPRMTWLPPLPTLWHPERREARTVLVLTTPNARRLLPWDAQYNSVLYYFRPVHFEVITLPELSRRERALEHWLETYLGRLSRSRRVWELHHAPDFRDRLCPSVRAPSAG
jgi:hypothetical protein